MIVELPEWNGWRISGERLDWQIQEYAKDAKEPSGHRWKGVNFYPSLEAASGAAYERTLRESPKEAVDIREAAAECERVKARLIKAVRKAVGE